jgi:hypothetical protein
VPRAAVVQRLVERFELRRVERPVVEQRLHPPGDRDRVMRERQVARHDDQLTVARAVAQGGEFHSSILGPMRAAGILERVGRKSRPIVNHHRR